MADEGYRLIITALDKTSSVFAASLRAGRAFASEMKNVITAPFSLLANPSTMAAVYNIKALAGMFESLYAAQDEQRQASTKLQGTLRATGHAAGLTAREIQDLASSLQETTAFDGDDIVNASAVMATFRNVSGGTFREGIKLATDMSATMGQDLQGSVVQVGKALNDPIAGVTALGRVGVTFNEVQKAQIKSFMESNELGKAQAIILDELRNEFAGVATEMAGGTGGAIKQIHIMMGDLTEGIANVLEPFGQVLTGNIKRGLAGANNTLGEIVDGVRIKFDSIKAVATEAFSVVGSTIRSALGDINGGNMSALEATIKSITRSVLAMAEAALMVKYTGSATAGVVQNVRGFAALMGGQLLRVFGAETFGKAMVDVGSGALDSGAKWGKERQRTVEQFGELRKRIGEVMASVHQATQITPWERLRDQVSKTAEEARSKLQGAFTRASSSIGTSLSNWADRAADAAKKSRKAADEIAKGFKEATDQLKNAVQAVDQAQQKHANLVIGRREQDLQFNLARAGNNPAMQNRLRFDQAKWLSNQANWWLDKPDMAMPMLEKAMGEAQNVRMAFAQQGAPRGDWAKVNNLIAEIDAMQRRLLDQQLAAARETERIARDKFNKEQAVIAAAEKRANMDEQVARGSSKLAGEFGVLKDAAGQLAKMLANAGKGNMVADGAFGAVNFALGG